jgi:hypothetical protein
MPRTGQLRGLGASQGVIVARLAMGRDEHDRRPVGRLVEVSRPDLIAHLRRTVRDALAINNPKWLGGDSRAPGSREPDLRQRDSRQSDSREADSREPPQLG